MEDYRKWEWESFIQKIIYDTNFNNLKKEDLIKNKKLMNELYNIFCFEIIDKNAE